MKIRLLILTTVTCTIFSLVSFAQEKPHVEVLYISGTPKVCLDNKKEYINAEEGMHLESGDKIKTDSKSSMGLGFDEDEDDVIEVGNDSDAVLILDENQKLELLEGRAFVTITDLPEGASFEVRTPTAVTGARGTDWLVVAITDSTDVEAIDGDIYVANFIEDGRLSEDRIIVVAGYQTTVERFRSPLPPRKIPRRTLEKRRRVKSEMFRRIEATRTRRRIPSRLDRLRSPTRTLRRPIRRYR